MSDASSKPNQFLAENRPKALIQMATGVPIVSDIVAMDTVAQIESRLSVCGSIEQTVNIVLLQAEAMRQSILKQEFEGRLA